MYPNPQTSPGAPARCATHDGGMPVTRKANLFLPLLMDIACPSHKTWSLVPGRETRAQGQTGHHGLSLLNFLLKQSCRLECVFILANGRPRHLPHSCKAGARTWGLDATG